MKKKNDVVTIYLFKGHSKKRYSISTRRIRFYKTVGFLLVLILFASIGVNAFFVSKVKDYEKMKAQLNDHKRLFKRAVVQLQRNKKTVENVIERVWRLSLSHTRKPWEGGDPEVVEKQDLLSLMDFSLNQINEEVGSLDRVTGDLYRVFLSPDSPYQWIPNYYPVTGEIVAPFGEYKDPFTQKVEQHNGVGIIVPFGTPVRAAAAGKIVYVGKHPRYGRIVKISHGFGLETIYGHIGWVKYPVGHYLKKGEVFAITGNTGKLIEPILYFEVDFQGKPYDPSAFLLGGK